MKTKLDHLIIALAILAMSGGGVGLEAHADESVSVSLQLTGRHDDAGVIDFYASTNFGSTYGVFDTFQLVKTFSAGGAYANYDLERNIVGGYVYHTLHISGSAINSGFEFYNGSADSGANSGVQIQEDMMIQYVPDSFTDTPPTQVSFQESYLLQGQLQIEMDDWSIGAYNFSMEGGGDDPANYTISISSNVVTSVTTVPLNQKFSPSELLQAGVNWDNFFLVNPALNPQPGNRSSFDLRFYFRGFVNIVDQNGQPIPANKLIFWCVNSNDTTQRIPFASQPDLAIEQAITLTAIPGTGSLTLQWPSYATNYQLQTTPGLGNAVWTTNGLPAPVVSGPFLQVTVPTTNAAAFFRLLQIN